MFSKEDQTRPFTDFTFTFFDTETTGLSFENGADLIEIAAVRVKDMEVLESFQTLLKPIRMGKSVPISMEAFQVHGIPDFEVSLAPRIEEIYSYLMGALSKDSILVAHNAKFDIRFLKGKLMECGLDLPENPVLCSLALSRNLPCPKGSRHNLEALREKYGVAAGDTHRALEDARALCEIFHKMVLRGVARGEGIPTLGDILRYHGPPLAF